MKNLKKLTVSDLINVGIFTTLYFIVMFLTGAVVRLIPILIIFMPTFIGITCGTIYTIYIAKVGKSGMIFLMAFLIGLTMSIISGIWIILIVSVIVGLISDILTSKWNYKNKTINIISYSIFNCWSTGGLLSIWLLKDLFIEKMSATGGKLYAEETVKMLSPLWVLGLIILFALLGGLIGGLLGNKFQKKHFKNIGC